ncbi:glycoside hydrolase family 43 protein [Sphingobacterium sp. lm-10]|uniref:glycoside hydrolase family 43 protein n=1 Tax=Sphingobacterium sp. lm-10 TaxID=2944904 RepID=UPI002021E31A|nr:glycoside hydrolase family 43 protein [Sphingobacterium sp. lm-10]MCL7986686.1 glycoside hydrolase family 43 protein [Sphingobacterium sp. lm-10]
MMIKKLKNISSALLYASSVFLFGACQQDAATSGTEALFSNFNYTGNDAVYDNYPLPEGQFYSPILQGCYPDPSITRKGEDYYLVNSSFVMFPGVPIFHSTDLVNWKQLGHVLDRESQLDVKNAGISEGIYAPDIQYNPHNDTFYMVTTQISAGIGNMVVKTDDPKKGDWTDPIKLNFDGIDPALFFDDDGKAYIVHNDAPDEGKELYKGHRVIKIWDYDLEKDQVIAGTDQIIVDGGVDIQEKPIWIEGPHIYKKDGKYFLMCAEGGTGGNHSEVIFIGDSPRGPFKPAATNPILSQRHLDKSRTDRVEWAGHADLVEGPGGAWYGVFLAVRPNSNNLVNTGRETFILPVDWTGKWPVFAGGMEALKPYVPMPEGVSNQTQTGRYFPNGNFSFQDNFQQTELDARWVALRGSREKFLRRHDSGLHISPSAVSINEKKPISALFYRQQHKDFTAEVDLNYLPRSHKDLAGITCMQSEAFYYTLGLTKKNDEYYLVLEQMSDGVSTILAQEKIKHPEDLSLRVASKNDYYQFSFKQGDADYRAVGDVLSGNILSTDVAGGFTGALIGLYATSANHIAWDTQ